MITALLLFVPFGIWALMAVSATPGVGVADQVIGLAAGLLIHAAIIGYARVRVTALAKGSM